MKVISREYVQSLLPQRDRDINKGDCGRVLITGGCTGMTGAVVLCAEAALRTGSGLVTVAVPQSLNLVFEVKLTEAMSLPLDCDGGAICGSSDKALDFASKCDALAIGPGMGTADCTAEFFEEFIKKSRAPVIIDADGLNLLSKNSALFPYIKGRAVLTPHPGEMSRLMGLSITEINNNRKAAAQDFAKKSGAVVVLKGMNTIVTNGNKTLVCDKGNPGMATGGSGDCLTGIILSLAGQGRDLFDAACGGVYLHALAGDIAADNVGEYSLIASDIIKYLPEAVKQVQKGVM
jgi:NAD(P)H-hydrate epimerase